ncbi:MAG: 7-cyano-7-deazaguanine synthase QueC [Planctomycetota bacterium]
MARDLGYRCHTINFDYGQRHRHELEAATLIADRYGTESHRVMPLDLRAFGGSALTDDIEVPKGRTEEEMAGGIPITYVPARNLIFLSLACAYAEVVGAMDVFIGVNAVDYSGYPDCRPEFVQAFEATANLATKAGVEGARLTIRAPLIDLTKAQIIERGVALGLDYALTHSCYDPDERGLACGGCDSCVLRREGFEIAGLADPTRYAG